MIEMDEQFQREFGLAMADLKAVHQGLIGTANNSRGEARALVADGREDEAVACYEVAHAFWTAANRLRPAISLFEDADRRAASLMEQAPKPDEPSLAERAYQERIKYLEGQLERLDAALRGRPATLGEKIRETESTEDLVDAVIARIASGAETEFDVTDAPTGTLIAGEWVSAAGSNRKIYVGRLARLDPDGPVIEYVCDCGNGGGDEGYHVVSTKLSLEAVRLPTADEIIEFDKLSEASGFLKLDGDE